MFTKTHESVLLKYILKILNSIIAQGLGMSNLLKSHNLKEKFLPFLLPVFLPSRRVPSFVKYVWATQMAQTSTSSLHPDT